MKDDHSLNDNDFNSCRSDYNNREVHLVILYQSPYIQYMIDYRLIKNGEIENMLNLSLNMIILILAIHSIYQKTLKF